MILGPLEKSVSTLHAEPSPLSLGFLNRKEERLNSGNWEGESLRIRNRYFLVFQKHILFTSNISVTYNY